MSEQSKNRVGVRRRGAVPCIARLASLCLVVTTLAACTKRGARTEAEAQPARTAARARFAACLPERKPEGAIHLAVSSLKLEGEDTRVRVVAYAVGEAADFDLPQYVMSRGRWLINDRARSYLLDESCREYRLKDRKVTLGEAPQGGRVRLGAGESCEFTLVFPRLPDEALHGALVYGGWTLPFYVLPEPSAPPLN